MFTNEQLKTILSELNGNSDAYLKAMKKVGPLAAEKLNERVSKITDIIEKIQKKLNEGNSNE